MQMEMQKSVCKNLHVCGDTKEHTDIHTRRPTHKSDHARHRQRTEFIWGAQNESYDLWWRTAELSIFEQKKSNQVYSRASLTKVLHREH